MLRLSGFLATLMLALGLSHIVFPVFASDTWHHTKYWNTVGIGGSMSADKRLQYYVEPNLRFVDESEIFDRTYLEAALGYQLFPRLTIWLGTEWETVKTSGDVIKQQPSIWQQLSWVIYSHQHVKVSDRIRLDERYRFTASGTWLRLRKRIEFEFPLDFESKFSLVLNEELFINVTNPSWVSNTFVDQNRALVALRTRINKLISFDIGYMNQYEFKSTNEQSNVICLAVAVQNE